MKCAYCESSSADNNFLFETSCWKVFLAFEQAYVGRSLIILKRHAATLTDLTDKELLDFHK